MIWELIIFVSGLVCLSLKVWLGLCMASQKQHYSSLNRNLNHRPSPCSLNGWTLPRSLSRERQCLPLLRRIRRLLYLHPGISSRRHASERLGRASASKLWTRLSIARSSRRSWVTYLFVCLSWAAKHWLDSQWMPATRISTICCALGATGPQRCLLQSPSWLTLLGRRVLCCLFCQRWEEPILYFSFALLHFHLRNPPSESLEDSQWNGSIYLNIAWFVLRAQQSQLLS